MRSLQNSFVCVTTPIGKGAIALVEVLGKGALGIVSSHFTGAIKRPLKSFHGFITDNDKKIDEVLVRYVPADASFTGLDSVEISCHGSVVVQNSLIELFSSKGFRKIMHGEYLDIALANKRIDLMQHEAYLAIQNAKTRLAAQVLNDQVNGALSKAVRESSDLLYLLKTADFGIALATPLQITIIGTQNAGKSTLFNALLQKERALVYDQPGTTRDPVKDYLSIEGIPFLLCDTAGVETPREQLEKLSIERTMDQIEKSDLLIHVFDATREPSEEESKLRELVKRRKVINVLNKVDIKSRTVNFDHLETSAKNGVGIDELRKQISNRFSLVPKYVERSPVIFTHRQFNIIQNHSLERARELLLNSR